MRRHNCELKGGSLVLSTTFGADGFLILDAASGTKEGAEMILDTSYHLLPQSSRPTMPNIAKGGHRHQNIE